MYDVYVERERDYEKFTTIKTKLIDFIILIRKNVQLIVFWPIPHIFGYILREKRVKREMSDE